MEIFMGTGGKQRKYLIGEWLGGNECSDVITTATILKKEIQQIYKIPDYKFWEIPDGINVGKINRKMDPGNVKRRYGIHQCLPVVLVEGWRIRKDLICWLKPRQESLKKIMHSL